MLIIVGLVILVVPIALALVSPAYLKGGLWLPGVVAAAAVVGFVGWGLRRGK